MKPLTHLLFLVLMLLSASNFAQSEKAPGTRPGPVSYSDEKKDLQFEYPFDKALVKAERLTDRNIFGDKTKNDQNKKNKTESLKPPDNVLSYCDASTETEDEFIYHVNISGINFVSSWQGGVADYTSYSTTIAPGASKEITVSIGNDWIGDLVYVWVDWNKDNEFETGTSNEQFILTEISGYSMMTFIGSVVVPAGQAVSSYRMRIRLSYINPPEPCGNEIYGEIEDYTVKVGGVVGPEIQINPMELNQSLYLNDTATQIIMMNNIGDSPLNFNVIYSTTPLDIPMWPPGMKKNAGLKKDIQLPGRIAVNGLINDPDDNINSKLTNISTFQSDDVNIRYDDGVNFEALGLVYGGTFQIAAYFPAASMAQYTGLKLTKLGFYINTVPASCKIKVYGPGSSNVPGELLDEEIVNPTGTAWNIIPLSYQVNITGEDLWIGYEVTHQANEFPCGYDNGPAVAGFGDMISMNNSTWSALSNYGFDLNWNLVGYIGEGGPVPVNDVGVLNILSPVTGLSLGEEEVIIRVKNFGTETQNNIPVFFTLDGGVPVTGLIEITLANGATVDYTFNETVNLGAPGHTYDFMACTTLPGDEIASNDCKTTNVTNIIPEYCSASTVHQNNYIANVLCGTINKSSGWQGGVANYTNYSTTIYAGGSQIIFITNGAPWPTDFARVWVDWNNNFIFDTGTNEEFVLTNVGGTGTTFAGSLMVPYGTSVGNHRMRIRLTYSITPVPCGNANYGEIEDYTINVVQQPANDVGIQFILSPVSGPINQEEEVSIRVKNYGSITQSNIPVFFTLDGGEPVTGTIPDPVAPGETVDFTFPGTVNLGTVGQTYFFNACTTLENDEIPDNNCKTISVTNLSSDYCDAYTQVQQEYISNVLLGSINKASGWQSGIADYTAISTTIQTGFSKVITITNGYAVTGDQVSAWVDWNNDYFFNSENEVFLLSDISGTCARYTGVIAVPADIAAGSYRLRIRMTNDENPDPCGYASLGEIEDYTINVFVPPTVDVGVLSIISPVSGTSLSNEIVTIRVKNYGTVTHSNIPVFYTLDGGEPVTGTIPGPVASGETIDFTFAGTANLGTVGQTYIFNACTALENDEIPENNCKTVNIYNFVCSYCWCETSIEDEYITNVAFGSINNSSGWQGGVANYTSLNTIIPSGGSEIITVTNGNAWDLDKVTVWVDWNKDCNFDYGYDYETYVLANVGGTGEIFKGLITVPEGIAPGDYRVRIRMTYSVSPFSCGSATYGEVEDYFLKVAEETYTSWLTVNPLHGSLDATESMNFNVMFNSSFLTIGTYNGSIVFYSNDPDNPIIAVPVMLNVVSCSLPAPVNIEGFEILPNMAYLSWQAPEIPGDLLGYNVYRNNEKINPDIVFNLFYEDSLVNPSQYFYFITAVYPECEASSDTISLVITNLPEMENDGVTIFPNPAGNFVTIQSEIKISQVTIMNNLGEVVFQKENPGEMLRVNTSDFPGGIYLVRLTKNDSIISKKLIIK